ncbi:MAG: hypothetical protein D6775_15305 [Caldilineae bacterium]|nr:MAG: hypothetical protein D6775_15305 [Caldilineae bacterium]
MGGLAVNLLAPVLFRQYWEFYLGLGVMWFLLLALALRLPERVSPLRRRVAVVAVAAMTLLVWGSFYIQSNANSRDTLAAYRNFSGVITVKEKFADRPADHFYVLTHGITTHGYQFRDPARRALPTAYYWEARLFHDSGDDLRAKPSLWVLLGRAPRFFDRPEIHARAQTCADLPAVRLWTDDYSNLFQVLK